MANLSVVIITYNEERNIERCIHSLPKAVAEVIVLDSGSTDNTIELAKQLGAKVYNRPFDTFAEQKNYACSLAKSSYLLNLDADECLSDELRTSIQSILLDPKGFNTFSMNRKTNFCGYWVRYCGWYPDKKIRLWERNSAKWGGKNPHEKVIPSKGAMNMHLKGDLLHYAFLTEEEHITQIEKYSTMAAQYAYDQNQKMHPLIHIYIGPVYTFFKKYILKLGFLDGYYGWVISRNTAFSKYLKYKKLYALIQSS